MREEKNRGGRAGGPPTPHETRGSVEQMMTRLGLSFKCVEDPRASRGRRYTLEQLLRLLVVALAVGRRVLRQAEELGADMVRQGTAPEGQERGASDTTLDRLLSRMEPEGLDETLRQVVRAALKQGVLREDDAFGRGVVSIDGKAAGGAEGMAPCEPCRTTQDDQGRAYWYAYSLRACLTSSAARPVLDHQPLGSKEGEATAFPQLFKQVVRTYGAHFKYVTVDAGMTSAENARVVGEQDKHYLFALKGNLHRLYSKAWVLLAAAPVQVRVRERAKGAWVERELRVVDMPSEEDFPFAQQLVWVRHTSTRPGTLPTVETRLFLTSVPRGKLCPQQLLALVRLHWGVENGPNWTADVLLEEDDASPCYRGKAPLVLVWLRLLAYNLLALVRTHLPPRDGRPASFARTLEILYQALLGLPVLPESLVTLA